MKALFSLFALAVVLVAGTSTASAAVWTFASGDNQNEYNVRGSIINPIFGANETINTHPNWEQNHETVEDMPGTVGGKWVSFGETGFGDQVIPNVWTIFGHLGTPSAIFFEEIDLTGVTTLASAKLSVWADDTASVGIFTPWDFNVIAEANTSIGDYCANGQVGCTPGNGIRLADVTSSLVAGQKNYLVMAAYQRAGGPFGVMYEGFYSDGLSNDAPTPEPATLGLMGSALAGLAFWTRKRNKSVATK